MQATYDLKAEYARRRYQHDGISLGTEEEFLGSQLPARIESLRARSYFDDSGQLNIIREGGADPRDATFLTSLMDLSVEEDDGDRDVAPPGVKDE